MLFYRWGPTYERHANKYVKLTRTVRSENVIIDKHRHMIDVRERRRAGAGCWSYNNNLGLIISIRTSTYCTRPL